MVLRESLGTNIVPVRLVVTKVLAPVNGPELEEAERGGAFGPVAGDARRPPFGLPNPRVRGLGVGVGRSGRQREIDGGGRAGNPRSEGRGGHLEVSRQQTG